MLRNSQPGPDRLSRVLCAGAAGAMLLCGVLAAGLRGANSAPQALANDSTAAEQAGQAAPADTIDLKYLCADAVAFAAVRPAAIFKRPELAQIGKIISEYPNSSPYLPVTDLEQVTTTVLSIPEKLGPGSQNMVMIYQAVSPNDFQEYFRRLSGAVKKQYGDKNYVVRTGQLSTEAAWKADDRTLVVASAEETLKKFISGPRGLPRFVTPASWQEFQHDEAVAAVEAALVQGVFKLDHVPKPIAPLAPLWNATAWGMGGIRFGKEMTVHGTAFVDSQAAADRVVKTLETARVLAQNALKQARSTAGSGNGPQEKAMLMALKAGDELLNRLQIRPEEMIVRVEGSVQVEDRWRVVSPGLVASRQAGFRVESSSCLQQILIAIVAPPFRAPNAPDTFPPAYSTDNQGKPLLSWRVLILPQLNYKELYEQFHLHEPWDSEHNKKLIEKMPQFYRSPGSHAGPGKTNYLAVRTERSVFPGAKPVSHAEISGTSNPIMIVEASDERAVIWTKPDDFVPDPRDPIKGLVGLRQGGFLAGLVKDLNVRFIPETIDPETLRHLFNRADKQEQPVKSR